MYFVDFNKMKIVNVEPKPEELITVTFKLVYRPGLFNNYETVRNGIAQYLDHVKKQNIDKSGYVFFNINVESNSGLSSDEFVSVVNIINAAIYDYMIIEDSKRKREHRLNAPDNLIRGVHTSVGLIKKACNYELKSDCFNVFINLTEHRGESSIPDTSMQYIMVDGKEDK